METGNDWAIVGLAFVQMLQVVALAWINRRGVVLPPTNRRTRNTSRGPAPSRDRASD